MSHLAYDIRMRTTGKGKEQRGTIELAVSMRWRLIEEAQTDIIDHSHIMVVHLWELEKASAKKKRKTRVVNIYDNSLKTDYV